MTRADLEEALNADGTSYMRTRTVEEAIAASDERPGMEAIRDRQNLWRKFWSRRGTNPIQANPELAH